MTATPAPAPAGAINAEAALSDEILQAARGIVERNDSYFERQSWSGAGKKNLPLLILLDYLIGACEPLANAVADNAWDDTCPIPADGAKRLAEDLHRIADTISAAAAAPDASAWSLPSCTGKELV